MGEGLTARALIAFVVAALLAGCSASRPPACDSGGESKQSVPNVAGRVLVGIAEVLVGAELVDHRRDDRRAACPDVVQKGPTERVPTASDPPLAALVAQAREHDASTPQTSHSERTVPSARPAVKSEPAQGRQGRWILVRKSARTLSVFDAEHRIKTYPVVFGADPVDPKVYEGDRRTPEGEYHIIGKHAHPEWQRFLLLDYPNGDNREAYAQSRADGLVPARGGKVVGTGGAIGIHGTKDDDLNRKGINWTYGCISLLSRDIQEVYDLVPVGTLVVIEH